MSQPGTVPRRDSLRPMDSGGAGTDGAPGIEGEGKRERRTHTWGTPGTAPCPTGIRPR